MKDHYNMDRNTIIGLLLIATILIGYSLFTRPSREEQAEMQRKRDSIALAEQFRMQEEQRIQAEQTEQAGEQTPVPDRAETGQDAQLPASPEDYRGMYGAFAKL